MKPHGCAVIVDDALFMREVIRDALEPMFDRIVDIGDADNAVETVGLLSPELVTLDLSLDAEVSVQGLDVLRRIRKYGAKVIVISALDQSWLRDEVFRSGAHACLAKPFAKDALRGVVRRLMEVGR